MAIHVCDEWRPRNQPEPRAQAPKKERKTTPGNWRNHKSRSLESRLAARERCNVAAGMPPNWGDEALFAYADGMSNKEICQVFECNITTATQAIKNAAFYMTLKALQAETVEELIEIFGKRLDKAA